ncbi:MAG: PAS domain S-box protein [Promethearchaeota archaeon]|jgi:PAS domain S-box-containing protein
MLEESFLNLQITILLIIGTLIFIFVSFKRRDLLAYLPSYLIIPFGYLFIYLQIYDVTFRLLGNFLFLIGILTYISAIYYEYYKTIKKRHGSTTSNPNSSKIMLSLSPITSLIIGIQIIFAILILIAIIMLIKLFLMKRSTKHATLIVFLASALLTIVATILSYFPLPGMWELSFVAMIILSAIYLMFPILIFLEEKLAVSKIKEKESEEKFRKITEESHLAFIILQDNVVKYANQKLAELSGYSLEEILSWEPGEFLEKAIAPDSVPLVMDQTEKKQRGDPDVLVQYPVHLKKKSGEIYWVDEISNSIMYEGRPADLISLIDLTDKINTELELKESEEKYRSLFENSPIALMDQDFSEVKRYINHLKASGINDFKKYFDDNPDEVIKCMSKAKLVDVNRKALEVYKSNSKKDLIFNMNQLGEDKGNKMTEEAFLDNKLELLSLINGDTTYESEIVTKTSTGDNIAFFAKTSIVPGFESTWSKVIVSIIDITDRKLIEHRLRESEGKFKALFKGSPVPTITWQKLEGDFQLIDYNKALLEYSKEDISKYLKVNASEFFRNRPDILKDIHRCFNEKINITREIKYYANIFEEERDFSIKIAFIPPDLVLLHLDDITERKEVEQLIIEENKKLVELSKLREELITRISHELRTPLTSMYAASQILLQSNKEDSIEKIFPYIEISHHGSIRLKELVDNLLDSSRIENRQLELKFSNENLNAIINDCIKELNYLADNRQLTLHVDLTMDVYFKLDKHRFPQVIINILSNALKNTPPNGMIFVSLNETNKTVEIIIKDTGVGLIQEEKEKLFEKFGKIERYGMGLDVDIEGAGLGLYISKEIVELHGGQILVESEGRNKGSSFIIRLNKEVDKN